ncbi:MAG: hypothetical protein II944_08865 [Ruminobacter sp.]|nr:hypothetical protein [Ruminobacter sp.]
MKLKYPFMFSNPERNLAGSSSSEQHNNIDGSEADDSQKQVYLNSFNKITFKENSINVENKYQISRQALDGCFIYTIKNLNQYWKEEISFDISFDTAELEKVCDDDQYKIRYFHFSLWSQERFSGKLILRFGYEDDCHEHSQKIFDFFNCKPPINYIKME